MPNANRTRAIMAAQKVRGKSDPRPIDNTPPKLTPEQRREMYAPKSALEIIPNRPPMPLRVLKGAAKFTAWTFSMVAVICGGLLVSESKTGLRS